MLPQRPDDAKEDSVPEPACPARLPTRQRGVFVPHPGREQVPGESRQRRRAFIFPGRGARGHHLSRLDRTVVGRTEGERGNWHRPQLLGTLLSTTGTILN